MFSEIVRAVKQVVREPKAREIARRVLNNSQAGLPLSANLVMTPYCQLNCDFCNFGTKANGYFKKMLTADGRGIPDSYADVLAALNVASLTISGVEPLTDFKRLVKIVGESSEINRIPHIQVITNGGLLTSEKYKGLGEAGLDELVISLDFASEMHSKMRHGFQLYERLEETLACLVSIKGWPGIRINTIVMSENLIQDAASGNVHDILGVLDFAGKLGFRVSFGAYSPGRDSNDSHMPKAADKSAVERTLKYVLDVKARTDLIINTEGELRNAFGFLSGIPVKNCSAGRLFVYINYDGRLMPCPDRPFDLFDTLKGAQGYEVPKSCTDCAASCRLVPEEVASAGIVGKLRIGGGYSGMLRS